MQSENSPYSYCAKIFQNASPYRAEYAEHDAHENIPEECTEGVDDANAVVQKEAIRIYRVLKKQQDQSQGTVHLQR